MKKKLLIVVCLILFTNMLGLAQENKTILSGEWQNDFSLPGVSFPPDEKGCTIKTIAFGLKGEVYVGGKFKFAGPVETSNIAMWDKNGWHALDSGIDGPVNSMVLDSKGNLYVGGAFTTAGNINCGYIAKWDGSEWQDLGGGFDSTVVSLVCDTNDNLYAGGNFTTNGNKALSYIAKWDGSSWSALGTGVNKTVHCLAYDKNHTLYVSGGFTMAGEIAVNNIASWDGDKWTPLASGLEMSFVNDMSVSPDGILFVNGVCILKSTGESSYLAQWDGTEWQNLSNNLPGAVYSHSFSQDGKLIIANGNSDYTDPTIRVLKQIDSQWFEFTPSLNGIVNKIKIDSKNQLYATGGFTIAGKTAAYGIAHWDGEKWNGLGEISGPKGCSDTVLTLASDGNNGVYAGGDFITAGEVAANHVAHFDGLKWNALGQGFVGTVEDVTTDAQGVLYAAGLFKEDDPFSRDFIARWNGIKWESLNSGLNGWAYSLATDPSGNLYAGGNFNYSHDTIVNSITMWDGENWNPLGSGCECDINPVTVPCVGTIASDTKGNIYIGGRFSAVGGLNTGYIAQWNGEKWSALGSGVDGQVSDIVVDENDFVYVCGSFNYAGSLEVNGIACWDGSQWKALGKGLDNGANQLYINNGTLYATTLIARSINDYAIIVAAWNGDQWQISESAADNGINSLAAGPNGRLYAGGSFTRIGNTISRHFGLFLPTENYKTGDVNHDNSIDIIDTLLIAQYYVGLEVQNFDSLKADVNLDNVINIVDALLVAQFYVGLINQL